MLKLQGDERLISLVRDGDPGAFDIIVDRYHSRLLGFCRQMLGSTEDAEDVLQEVFVNAFRAMVADQREINLRPWLYRIARNRCLNHLRKPVADAKESMDAVPVVDAASTHERVHNREEFRQLLSDVKKLPETQRAALLLREMDAISYEEIAQAMETTVPSVKSLLVRARISLAEASQARLLTCGEVRLELAEAAEGLCKASGPARRHVRECAECGEFRTQIRSDSKVLAALSPIGPLLALKGLLASKLGLGGGAGTGATSAAGTAGAGAGGAGSIGAGAGALGAGAGALSPEPPPVAWAPSAPRSAPRQSPESSPPRSSPPARSRSGIRFPGIRPRRAPLRRRRPPTRRLRPSPPGKRPPRSPGPIRRRSQPSRQRRSRSSRRPRRRWWSRRVPPRPPTPSLPARRSSRPDPRSQSRWPSRRRREPTPRPTPIPPAARRRRSGAGSDRPGDGGTTAGQSQAPPGAEATPGAESSSSGAGTSGSSSTQTSAPAEPGASADGGTTAPGS